MTEGKGAVDEVTGGIVTFDGGDEGIGTGGEDEAIVGDFQTVGGTDDLAIAIDFGRPFPQIHFNIVFCVETGFDQG